MKHPVQMKRAVFPAAAILQLGSAGEKAAAKKDDAGLAGPAVSAVAAPVVQRTVPLFNGLAASTDQGDSPDIRLRALLRTQDSSESTMIEAGEAGIRPIRVHLASGGRPKWRQPQVLVIGARKEERDSRVSK